MAEHTWGDPAYNEDPDLCTSCYGRRDWPIAKQPCSAANTYTCRTAEVGEVLGRYVITAARKVSRTRQYEARCTHCLQTGIIRASSVAKISDSGVQPQWCTCPRTRAKSTTAGQESSGSASDVVGGLQLRDLVDDAKV